LAPTDVILAAATPSRGIITLFPKKNVRDSSTAHTAVKVVRRRNQRALARKELIRNTPGTKENAPRTARSTARFCSHGAHSMQQQAAAARSAPPSRCCCRLSSALLHSCTPPETLPEQELRFEASSAMLKRALLVACKVRFHHGSALECRNLHRFEALFGLFRPRTTAPKWLHYCGLAALSKIYVQTKSS